MKAFSVGFILMLLLIFGGPYAIKYGIQRMTEPAEPKAKIQVNDGGWQTVTVEQGKELIRKLIK